MLSFGTAVFLLGGREVVRCLGDPGAWSYPEIPVSLPLGSGRGELSVKQSRGGSLENTYTKWDVPDLSLNMQFRNWLQFSQFNQTGPNFLQLSPDRSV